MKAGWISISAGAAVLLLCAGQALTYGGERTAEALVAKSGCLDCHDTGPKIIGPTFRDIAARYEDDDDAREELIETVKHGGKGNWTELTGGVPMPPYSPRLSDEEVEELVDWLLSSEWR